MHQADFLGDIALERHKKYDRYLHLATGQCLNVSTISPIFKQQDNKINKACHGCGSTNWSCGTSNWLKNVCSSDQTMLSHMWTNFINQIQTRYAESVCSVWFLVKTKRSSPAWHGLQPANCQRGFHGANRGDLSPPDLRRLRDPQHASFQINGNSY